MAKRKGKTLAEAFSEEQENAVKQLEQIKSLIATADRVKPWTILDDADADRITAICDAVQLHLRGRRQRLASLVRNEPSLESAMWEGRTL
jgi:hypothetical protein